MNHTAAILNLWHSGMNTDEIAHLVGCPEYEVYNLFARLDHAGGQKPKTETPNQKVT